MSKNKFYVTTPIYYVNAAPHIGSAYTTIAADLSDNIALEMTGVCRTPDGGRELEQSLRAMLSLSAAASARQAGLAALIHGIQIRREDRMVRLSLSTNPDAIAQLLQAF